MKDEIRQLRKKHKKFVEKIEGELIRENDDRGNASRLEDYLVELEGKRIKHKSDGITAGACGFRYFLRKPEV